MQRAFARTVLMDYLDIVLCTLEGFNKMVTVNRRWHRGRRHSGKHKLQDGHLRGRILHRHAIYQIQRSL
jgi:hypothetical protein